MGLAASPYGELPVAFSSDDFGGTIRLPRNVHTLTRMEPRPGAVSHNGGGIPPAPVEQSPHMPSFAATQREPMRSDAAIGGEVRRLRRAQGKTQKTLAEHVGVTGAQLHRYETGTTRIATSRLIAIAEALGVRADSLISAGSATEPDPHPKAGSNDDDIVELIHIFGTITDPRHRSALVAVARMMATHYQRRARSGDAG
ncbi:helix-turn-helix domain-containing protein [Humitalea sp. 24SJ18S-53]|uniref:helix-turn-helix domain-containing protein n=1 Tax=Humitalea sp. 24SJ18S-53 TaxID=3422307 RepID=UPI003D6767BB